MAARIERERVAKRLSVRGAAAAAEISEGRWRQIAKGYQSAAAGTKIPVNAPAETLARMAAAVGLYSTDLPSPGLASQRFQYDPSQRDLIAQVQAALKAMEETPSSAPASADSEVAHLQKLVAQLASRTNSLEQRVAQLEGQPADPDYSNLSQDDHGLAAYKGDRDIPFDADPED